MSESAVRGPGQLVPAVAGGSSSSADQMFSGLGLGDYVQAKDTGAIATGMMGAATAAPAMPGPTPSSSSSSSLSLEDKRRAMQQGETIKRMQSQPQVK